jgi:hypothetical protein
MGIVAIREDELIDHIHIYRESWAEHIGLVGGLNAFWLLILWALCKCCTTNQFSASLRREINPEIVEEADR